MTSIRLIVADDHALIRAGFRSILQSVPEFEVVGEASDGFQALELVARLRPHVLLTDIAMPNMNGLTVAERVFKEFPEVRVIIVSMHANEEFVGQAVRSGAAGYLLKDADAAELQFAINSVIRGESYLTPAVSKQMMSSYMQLMGETQSTAAAADPLTPRQREILRLITEGQTTKGIARILEISAKTVETHRSQIMDRLGIHDIPGLVRYAMRRGLVPGEKGEIPSKDAGPLERPPTE
ncbi:response regulator [Schlesneria paludicola]|uniref:response regulator n=1 Tax=Schlesneria paludicola TaxID=360056 RepID=UPI00029B0E47|nr:response regulator transcription factor [Schlesneria paludicola]